MDDLIEVRKEVCSIGSSKAAKQVTYWPVSPQARHAARLLERSWLYPCDLWTLANMGFRIVSTETVATVAPDATVSVVVAAP